MAAKQALGISQTLELPHQFVDRTCESLRPSPKSDRRVTVNGDKSGALLLFSDNFYEEHGWRRSAHVLHTRLPVAPGCFSNRSATAIPSVLESSLYMRPSRWSIG